MYRLFTSILLLLFALNANAQNVVQPREYRAVWLTTLQGLDWPRTKATDAASVERQQDELRLMLDQLQAAGINTVLLQTRIRGTVAYPSVIEPWDVAFTGRAGQNPGYDPLRFAIDEAHRRGMELHAWVVAFPLGKLAGEKALGRQALTKQHPELCLRAGEGWMMDPGVPETADYIARLCTEIVSNYDVDGIHLDYIRYPETQIAFNDDKTYRRYGGGMSKRAWRSTNVTSVVRKIHDAVKAQKPWVKLSCSPVGKYADLPRQSSKGWNARDAVSQDAVSWLRDGLMDVLFPMMYFDGNNFYPFALDWKERCPEGQVAPGLGIYLLAPQERNWPLQAVQRQLTFIENFGLDGFALFRARFLTDDVKGLYGWLQNVRCRQQARTPACPSQLPMPLAPEAQLTQSGHTLHFRWKRQAGTIYNIVYRYDENGAAVELARLKNATAFDYTPALPVMRNARYGIVTEDVYGRESQPAYLQLETHVAEAAPAQTARPDTLEGLAPAYYDLQGRRILRSSNGQRGQRFRQLRQLNPRGEGFTLSIERY
ncbi:MAG: family 10 glycosylhydrolase [Alloprevotella sp.]|nr:family 10 glycosylhydrolase [Alloprevotella sp.]